MCVLFLDISNLFLKLINFFIQGVNANTYIFTIKVLDLTVYEVKYS